MPIHESKYDNIKVYRPSGSATASYVFQMPVLMNRAAVMDVSVSTAVHFALGAFIKEFGREPDIERGLIFEAVVDGTGRISCTVFEFPDEDGVAASKKAG